MALDDYLPTSDPARLVWLANFANKFASYATSLGFVAADVTAVNADYNTFVYIVNGVQQYKDEYAERVAYKKIMADARIGTPAPGVPVAPTIAPPTPLAAPSIFPRIRVLVQKIKLSAAYNASIGKDLGVIGVGEPDPGIIKPKITVTSPIGVNVATVKFVKGRFDGIQLEMSTPVFPAFTLVAIALKSPFEHNYVPPANGIPETRQYRARFIKGNVAVGEYSDIVSVLVG